MLWSIRIKHIYVYDSVVHIIFLKFVVAFKKAGWVLSVEYQK